MEIGLLEVLKIGQFQARKHVNINRVYTIVVVKKGE